MTILKWIDAAYKDIAAQKWRFLVAFFVIVLITYFILYVIDFIPEPIDKAPDSAVAAEVVEEKNDEDDTTVAPVAATVVRDVDPLPNKIIFDRLDRELTVLNPESREVADLDAALLNGVVRHPDSADFVDTGNIFILGHSSYLPNVLNKNFQAFNGIQDLEWGDTVRVQSGDTEYTYRVDKVFEAKASEVVVPMDDTKAKLTLATCDSFGSKDDRFIVEAVLVKTETL